MFARVITANVGEGGFDSLVHSAEQELPGARQRPGFAGYLMLTDDTTGNAVTISLWQTREDMEAVSQGTVSGIHSTPVPETVLASMRLETYEVAVQA